MARLLLTKNAKALLRRTITSTPNRLATFPIQLSERTQPPHQSAYIVYDCSCKQSSYHPSLNHYLHVGPLFLTCMPCFCLYEYRFSADNEKAFLHVYLATDIATFSDYLIHKTLTAHFNFTVLRLSCNHTSLTTVPITSVSVNLLSSLYVDNVVSGCDTEQEAIQYFLESCSPDKSIEIQPVGSNLQKFTII